LNIDCVRDRYQQSSRVASESRVHKWIDGYDNDEEEDVMCANGCCYGDQHNDKRNDESDEESENEPFTNEETGEVDIKEATRWSLQRGSTIWYVIVCHCYLVMTNGYILLLLLSHHSHVTHINE
jgi:hypothetical protein